MKSKTKKRKNPQTRTTNGAFLLARDLKRIFSQHRHETSDTAVTEAKRIADQHHERILILKVVGVVDRRPKAATAAVPPVVEKESA